MRLIAKTIRISPAEFHCNRLTTVQDIQDYASLILGHSVVSISYFYRCMVNKDFQRIGVLLLKLPISTDMSIAGCSRDSVLALLEKYSVGSHCEPSMLSSCVVKRWFWLYFSDLP